MIQNKLHQLNNFFFNNNHYNKMSGKSVKVGSSSSKTFEKYMKQFKELSDVKKFGVFLAFVVIIVIVVGASGKFNKDAFQKVKETGKVENKIKQGLVGATTTYTVPIPVSSITGPAGTSTTDCSTAAQVTNLANAIVNLVNYVNDTIKFPTSLANSPKGQELLGNIYALISFYTKLTRCSTTNCKTINTNSVYDVVSTKCRCDSASGTIYYDAAQTLTANKCPSYPTTGDFPTNTSAATSLITETQKASDSNAYITASSNLQLIA